MDPVVALAKTVGKERKHEVVAVTEKDKLDYVDALLDVLGRHTMDLDETGVEIDGTKLPLHFVTSPKEIQTGYANTTSNWQVVSCVLVNNEWDQYLIVQENNHACRPVSILQLLHLLEYDIGFNKITILSDKNFAKELLAKPKFRSLVGAYIEDCVDHSSDLAKQFAPNDNEQEEEQQKMERIAMSSLLQKTKRWRFPSTKPEEDDCNDEVFIIGMDPSCFLLIWDKFPLIWKLRCRSVRVFAFKEQWKSPTVWEVMLPGCYKTDFLPIEEKFVLSHFNAKMVERAKRLMSKWIRVLACNYNPPLQEWTPSTNISALAEAHKNLWKVLSVDGNPNNIVRIRHFRFSHYSWLKAEIGAVVLCYKRRKQLGCVVLIPSRPYWFGELFVEKDDDGKNLYRSFYLNRKWVYDSFTKCLILLAIQKQGEWVVVPPSEIKEVYNIMVEKPEKN